jgi:hypothetical protein
MSSGSDSESDHSNAGSERKSNNVDTASDAESEDDGTFAWKVGNENTMRLGKKMNAHVLQAKGGLIANYFGKTALSFPKATIFGNRLEWILKDEEPKEKILFMIGLVLKLAEFTEYKDGFSLIMAQFTNAGGLSCKSLEDMTKSEVKATLSHVPGRIMGAAKRLDVCMRLNSDIRFSRLWDWM